MERKRGQIAALMWLFFVGVVSHNMVLPVMCRSFDGVEDQKNYYSHDPHRGSTPKHSPKGSPRSPSYGAPSPGYGGSGGGALDPGSPRSPSYGTPAPGYGGSGGGSPKSPSYGTPAPGYGGSGGGSPNSPSYGTPFPGSGGSGGSGGESHSSPYITPPTFDPVTPTTPSAPAVIPDPNTPPAFSGNCSYWGKHPDLIWGLFGFWGTMSGIFGAACTPAYGQDMSLHQALLNTRNDGIGALYREGAASLLNSMVNQNFPYTAQQVKDHFSAALVSDKAAAAQAQLFQRANEGRLKLKA